MTAKTASMIHRSVTVMGASSVRAAATGSPAKTTRTIRISSEPTAATARQTRTAPVIHNTRRAIGIESEVGIAQLSGSGWRDGAGALRGEQRGAPPLRLLALGQSAAGGSSIASTRLPFVSVGA